MRLIDADALKRRAITVRFFGKDIMMVSTSEIDDAPTIDAVQVVRCKDCVYFHNGDCYNGNFPIKGDLANVYFDMKETDFCSYGERKGGDSE